MKTQKQKKSIINKSKQIKKNNKSKKRNYIKKRKNINSKINKLRGGILSAVLLAKINDSSIKEIELYYIPDKDVENIVSNFKTNSLTTFSLKMADISTADNNHLKAISEVLKKYETTLTRIDISSSKITPENMTKLAEALTNNSTLKIFAINTTNIGDTGAIEVANIIKNNTSITEININGNNIGDPGANAISDALKNNITLEILNISNNNISDSGASSFADALKNNTTLETLDINHNNIGDSGGMLLLDALQNNISLINFYFSLTKMSDKIIKDIKNIINNNKLKLSFNPQLTAYISKNNNNKNNNKNNNRIIDDNIEFIKNTIKYKNFANNNTIDKVFDDHVTKLLKSYDFFKSLINNNYIEGSKSIKKLYVKQIKNINNSNNPPITQKQIVIDLHGEIANKIFKLPQNVNIVFLSPIKYILCHNFKPEIINSFNKYLENPNCIKDKDVMNKFKQAIIYYGGQYCIDLNLSRSDIDHVTGIYGINDSNEMSQDRSVLGDIPNFNSGDIKPMLLSKLLKKTNSLLNYTILVASCRGFPPKVILNKDLLIFYELTIKTLNLKINYENLNSEVKEVKELKAVKSIDNYVKECKDIYNSLQNNSTNPDNNTDYYELVEPNITTSKIVSSQKLNINNNTQIKYKGSYQKILKIKEYIDIINKTKQNIKEEFNDLFNALPIHNLLKINNNNNTVSKANINIINKIKNLFGSNYNLLYNYVLFCQTIVYVENTKHEFINDDKKSLLTLFINIIPELITSVDSIIIPNQQIAEYEVYFISQYLHDFNTDNVNILDISNNNIDNACIIRITNILEFNKSIKNLNVSNNNIDNDGIIAIAEALIKNNILIELNISNNKFDDIGAEKFAEALKINKTLIKLNISGNNINSDILIKINALLEINKNRNNNINYNI